MTSRLTNKFDLLRKEIFLGGVAYSRADAPHRRCVDGFRFADVHRTRVRARARKSTLKNFRRSTFFS